MLQKLHQDLLLLGHVVRTTYLHVLVPSCILLIVLPGYALFRLRETVATLSPNLLIFAALFLWASVALSLAAQASLFALDKHLAQRARARPWLPAMAALTLVGSNLPLILACAVGAIMVLFGAASILDIPDDSGFFPGFAVGGLLVLSVLISRRAMHGLGLEGASGTGFAGEVRACLGSTLRVLPVFVVTLAATRVLATLRDMIPIPEASMVAIITSSLLTPLVVLTPFMAVTVCLARGSRSASLPGIRTA